MTTITVCPNCDSAKIRRLTPRAGDGTPDHKWWCEDCPHRFDEPNRREPDGNTAPNHGLAAELFKRGRANE